ncbi:MAG: NAD(+) synthase [Christensenellales bacterium]
MKDGFIKVAAGTPDIRVADCGYNAQNVCAMIQEAEEQEVRLLVLPELCLTGYTCGDLFFQKTLQEGALAALQRVLDATQGRSMLVVLGLPLRFMDKLYNCAAVLYRGEILGVIPKMSLFGVSEFSGPNPFTSVQHTNTCIRLFGRDVPFGPRLLFCCEQLSEFRLGVEICEDLWTPAPPSIAHAMAGASVIANLSASSELVGKDDYRRELVVGQSARLVLSYIYANAGEGESTTDLVYSGHNLIAENGMLLKESELYTNSLLVSEIDVLRTTQERTRKNSFAQYENDSYQRVPFSMPLTETALSRRISAHPFIPEDAQKREQRCEDILSLQSAGLKKRLMHTRSKKVLIGISGGLDSALALLVVVRAMDALARKRKDIIAITMPCFGTSARTRGNAQTLCECLGVALRTIDIHAAVQQHLADIEHGEGIFDVTYENAQARERTQVLMDVANQQGGLVVGTGDLSELALGWATYNGDHMSMYGVNASVPKTLVRHLVAHEALRAQRTHNDDTLCAVLLDILDTPVSPELLPGDTISQKTEDIIGPYELHDFFLYYAIRWGFDPKKVLRLALCAFDGAYPYDTLLKWLQNFYKRFFSQQFKRSCLPDGPKVGSVCLSPRGEWQMPSDACAALWLQQLENLS